MDEKEAREVCQDRAKWKSVVYAYPFWVTGVSVYKKKNNENNTNTQWYAHCTFLKNKLEINKIIVGT